MYAFCVHPLGPLGAGGSRDRPQPRREVAPRRGLTERRTPARLVLSHRGRLGGSTQLGKLPLTAPRTDRRPASPADHTPGLQRQRPPRRRPPGPIPVALGSPWRLPHGKKNLLGKNPKKVGAIQADCLAAIQGGGLEEKQAPAAPPRLHASRDRALGLGAPAPDTGPRTAAPKPNSPQYGRPTSQQRLASPTRAVTTAAP